MRAFSIPTTFRDFGKNCQALTNTTQFENEQRALGKDGKYRWFLMQYNPLLDENRIVIRWYATGTDIDDP